MADRLFTDEFLNRLERMTIAAKHAMPGQTQGERRSPKRGQSVEFSDFRPYVAGDDFRRIDWNAYARLERFFIKLFVEEEDLSVHLIVDSSRSMNWGEPNKLEYARKVAGALGYVALAGLDRVTVTPVGANGRTPLSAIRGKRLALSLFSYLQALAPAPEGRAADPAVALRAFAASHSRPGLLVLVSDLMNDGWTEGLKTLASRGFEISLIHVLAPQEVNPELNGDLKLIDSEDNAEIEITADYDLLGRYRRELESWQEGLRNFCRARSITYIPVETSLPLDELLFAWMGRQGVLR